MSKEVNEQAKEVATVQETEEVDVEFEKRVKSEVSKAQHELLKDLGISNVKEGKELLEKGKTFDDIQPFKEKYEELNKEHESFVERYESLNKQNVFNETSIKLVSEGFNPERLESIKPLIDIDSEVDQTVENIKKTLPELFLSGTSKRTTTPKKKEEELLTDAEKYIKRQKEKMKR